MSWLNQKIGGTWHQVKSAFERSDIGIAEIEREDAALDGEVMTTTTRYTAVKEAVERRITMFLRRDLVSHLEIGFNEQFVLHYIEISADAQGRDVLAQFLREFSPEARVEWVKKLLGPAIRKHVVIDQFLGLDREFAVEDLAETDPFEEELNQALTPGYRVTLHGRWESRPVPQQAEVAEPAPAPSLPQAPGRVAGPRLRLAIADAKSPNFGQAGATRTVEIAMFPTMLGSSVKADVEISGYYVSATHCTFYCEQNVIWLEDHSTNGTWLNGNRVPRGNRVMLTDGALVGIGKGGNHGDKGFERYPEFRMHFAMPVAVDNGGHTPVAPAFSATPVAPEGGTPIIDLANSLAIPAIKAAPLAVLAIVDASGNPKRDILKLPFSIGRGSVQDYVVPDANEGVSREHLLIEDIDGTGAKVHNLALGKNGSFADGQALPEQFVWHYGQEIVLAERWTSAPAVRLCLRRVEQ